MLCCNDELGELWESILKRVNFSTDPTDLQDLAPWEKVFYFVFWLDCEIQNGGIVQFICNPGGDHYYETYNALNEIGATQTAIGLIKVQEEINILLSNNYDERNEQMAMYFTINEGMGSKNIDQTLDRIYNKYYDNNTEELLVNFVHQNTA
jgi:hypothetical protein